MSFTSSVKNEVSKLNTIETENIAELSALIRNIGILNENSIKIITENSSVARRIFGLLKDIYGVTPRVTVRKGYNYNKNLMYLLEVKYKMNVILEDLSLYQDNNYLSVVTFYIREGLLFGKHQDIFTSMGNISEELLSYIIHFYEKNNLLPKEIILPEVIDSNLLGQYLQVKTSIPQRGDIKKLVELASDNAKIFLNERYENIKKDETNRLEAEKELKELLGLSKLKRIETFDNSHLFGTFYVAGMVVFDHFEPNKNEYRKFKISADVNDDLGAMREVLYRRYYKVLMENLQKPDLIVMDGGITQVNVAKDIIHSLGLDIKIIGLVKDKKHKTNSIIDENGSLLPVKADSNLFLFFSRIQEEVHRYAINYHRNIKAKGALSSVLDVVPGIGEVRKKELLKKFSSVFTKFIV